MAWIDDNFDESCYEWARAARRSRRCWSRPKPQLGLEEAETDALIAWAAASSL